MAAGVLPPFAAWRHHSARTGFEVVFLRSDIDGITAEGRVCAVEDAVGWTVDYRIRLDPDWSTVGAHVTVHTAAGRAETLLQRLLPGSWLVDGRPAPELDGCLDVDLEASVFTNALPVHRSAPRVGVATPAPAAYVAVGLGVSRLDQTYRRLPDVGDQPRYAYAAPRFGYAGDLVYDESGLLVHYPGIAVRAP